MNTKPIFTAETRVHRKAATKGLTLVKSSATDPHDPTYQQYTVIVGSKWPFTDKDLLFGANLEEAEAAIDQYDGAGF